MRPSCPRLASLNWLSSLKASQLQRLAFLTGISSSGTKPVLTERLNKVLSIPTHTQRRVETGQKNVSSDRLSILSIDMGIRNLAFAHFLAQSKTDEIRHNRGFSDLQTPVLNAWNRLAVSDFPDPSAPGDISPSAGGKTTLKIEDLQLLKSNGKKPATDKESFAPGLYAAHAYTLIKSLVAAYQPTHILIERQRFRSGGGSAVLEWTLRVGVFEGMLYAVLQTLKMEAKPGDRDITVVGIEPQRVAKYWIEGDSTVTSTKRSKKRTTSREGKKAKIDLVGEWIYGAEAAQSGEITQNNQPQFDIAAGSQAQGVSAAFLNKWSSARKRSASIATTDKPFSRPMNDQSTRSTRVKAKNNDPDNQVETVMNGHSLVDIGKLDDLADCLLQGVSWLEWQKIRERVAHEGKAAIPNL